MATTPRRSNALRKKNIHLPREQPLPDGSYLSRIYPSKGDRRHKTNGIVVRVIEYCLDGVADAEPIYRLATSILDHEQAPAQELAALYHEQWEIETTLDELKTHLRGVLAQQDTGSRPPGVLWSHHGALCDPCFPTTSTPRGW